MQTWAHLMDALSPEQVDWILQNGNEERVPSGTTLVEEDGEVTAIYFLIEGLLHARTKALGSQALAVLGPGEVVGEISFVDGQRASASVVAQEDSLVLVLPRAVLEPALLADEGLAANFYRELARIACRRLRATAAQLGSATAAIDEGPVRQEVEVAVERFKRSLIEAEQAAEMAGEMPETAQRKVRREFLAFTELLNEQIGELLDPPSALNLQIGRTVQRELLPFVLQSQLGERLYRKPRGYGGDFSTLELIYKNQPVGEGALGRLIDACLLETPAIEAMRNRRPRLAAEIKKSLDEERSRPLRVLSIACGPASELLDVYDSLEEKARLRSTLVDVDFQALLHVSERVNRRGLRDLVQMTVKNLVYLALGRTDLDMGEQDLVYSTGLIDYFNDSMVVRILDHIHSILRPGGRVLVGNFHPSNPSKALFDHVLEWSLVHRTGEDVNRLFEESRFGRAAQHVADDGDPLYLLAECYKE